MVRPSSDPAESTDRRLVRRRFLTGVGAVTTGALAGCSGRLPGSGPRDLDTEVHENSAAELSWDFPPQSSDEDHAGIGYVEISRAAKFDSGPPTPTLGFQVNASIAPYSDYTLDQFTVRFATPAGYQRQHGDVTYFVEPSIPSDGVHTRYRRDSTRREFVVEARNVGSDGTFQLPVVLYGTAPLPSALDCRFSLQAATSGTFGETVHVADSGTFTYGTPE